MKKILSKHAVFLSVAAMFLLLFTTCDFNSLTDYIADATGSARGQDVIIQTTKNEMANGVTAIPAGETTQIRISLHNPRDYDLDLFLEGQGSEKAAAVLSDDRLTVYITIDDVERLDSFELTLKMETNGRPMPSIPLPKMEGRFFNDELEDLTLSYSTASEPEVPVEPGTAPNTDYYFLLHPAAISFDITVTLPDGAYSSCTVDGQGGATQDNKTTFTVPVLTGEEYDKTHNIEVTADSGISKTYTLRVIVPTVSSKDIINFSLGTLGEYAAISETGPNTGTIDILVKPGAGFPNFTPVINITGEKVEPSSDAPQDFSGPVEYKVTAVDGSTKVYTVTVKEAAAEIGSTLYPTLLEALDSIDTAGEHTVNILADQTLAPYTFNEGGASIIFKTENPDGVTVRLDETQKGRLFTIGTFNESTFVSFTTATLTLGSGITLSGHNNNEAMLVLVGPGSKLVMNAGSVITGNVNNNSNINLQLQLGGGVGVIGSFTMNGGKIHGNISHNVGGGVLVALGGTFTMNSGEIHDNKALGASGGGVLADLGGTFTMNGGRIYDNNAGSGGGVCVYESVSGSKGTFNMTSGEISGNTADNGGGVYVYGGSFTMSGGTVSGNNATDGGGVYVYDGSFNMSGGTVYGSGETNANTATNGASLYVQSGTAVYGGTYAQYGNIVATTPSGVDHTLPPPLGSAANPFPVNDMASLQAVGKNANTTTGNYAGWGLNKHYKLENDINLSSIPNWTPIGDNDAPFTGSFNGNGYKITGLTIITGADVTQRQGLFGDISSSGTVSNLGLEGVSINSSSANNVGGVVGYNNGTIENCYVTGTITGASDVGGIVGQNRGPIKNCYSTGSVTGTNNVGGIAGENMQSTVSNCYSTATVTGNSSVGGIVGQNYLYAPTLVQNCVALNPSVSGTSNVGRVVGENPLSSALSNNRARSDMIVLENEVSKSIASSATGVDGLSVFPNATPDTEMGTVFGTSWTFANWSIPSSTSFTLGCDLPTLQAVTPTKTPTLPEYGTPEAPILVGSAEDLQRIGNDPNWTTAHYRMTTDISLSSISNWTPIGNSSDIFNGSFDGNGKKITGLTITSGNSGFSGLFYAIGGDGVTTGIIRNLGLEEVNITDNTNGSGAVAVLNLGGLIENCYVTGTIAGTYAGSIVVENEDGIVRNCYSTASVTGTALVGGIVGRNSGGEVLNCYSTGIVIASGTTTWVGGIVGFNDNGTVSNCVALNPNVSGDTVGRVVGSSTTGLSNNRARNDMTVDGSIPSTNIGENQINGESVALGTALDTVFTGWNPPGNSIWILPDSVTTLTVNGALPTLRAVTPSSSAQAPTLPAP